MRPPTVVSHSAHTLLDYYIHISPRIVRYLSVSCTKSSIITIAYLLSGADNKVVIAQPLQQFYSDPHARKEKRIYHRMATGLQIAQNKNQDMRFLTLTTSKTRVYNKKGKIRTLIMSWQILRQRISRATMKKDGFIGFNLNKYYNLQTHEGNGVSHIVFWGGRYIPQKWLSRNWQEIHGAFQVNIQYIQKKRGKINGIVGYLIGNYLLNQPIKRMSYGWGWAWLGFCKSWDKVKSIYGRVGLRTRKGVFIFKGIPSFHYYFTQVTHYRINYPIWEKMMLKRDCTQTVTFWRGVLWDHPKTSRQTKFFTPSRGFNKNFFEKSDLPSKITAKKQLVIKSVKSSLRIGDFDSLSDYANVLLKNQRANIGYGSDMSAT